MTDRERKMIEAYLPHDPDPTLEHLFGYYVKDTSGRVHKCIVTDLLPGDMRTGEMEFAVVEESTGRRINPWYASDDPFRGFKKCDMYDNREDCKNDTHPCISSWEKLREVQKNDN